MLHNRTSIYFRPGYGMLSVQLPDDILGVEIVEEYRRVAGDEGIAPRSIRRPHREADALR